MGAAKSLRYVLITRLTPERLPVLASVLRACQQQGLQLWLTNPALQLLNDRAAADEGLANALKGVQVGAAQAGARACLSACNTCQLGSTGSAPGAWLFIFIVPGAAGCVPLRAAPTARDSRCHNIHAGGGGVARQRAAAAGQAHAALHPHPHAALARPGVHLQRGG